MRLFINFASSDYLGLIYVDFSFCFQAVRLILKNRICSTTPQKDASLKRLQFSRLILRKSLFMRPVIWRPPKSIQVFFFFQKLVRRSSLVTEHNPLLHPKHFSQNEKPMVLRLCICLIFSISSAWAFYPPGAIVAPMPKLVPLLSCLFVPELKFIISYKVTFTIFPRRA